MKKIAFISHDSSLNGGPICLAEICEGLIDSDFPAEIHFGLPSPGPLLSRYRLEGTRLFFFARGRGEKTIPVSRRRIQIRLMKIFSDRGIDGVVANTLESFQAIRAAARARIPSVWMIHEMIDAYRERKELPEIKKAAAATDILIFNSRASLGQLSLLGNGLEEKAIFVYNGIHIPDDSELEKDYRADLGLNPDDIILGSVGDVAPSKGYESLIRAFASVNKRFPATTLVIVGRQPRQFSGFYTDLKQLGRELGISDRLLFAGEQEKIHPWLISFDILVHPSRRESFGRVVVEALARSRPVVAARSGGVEEIDNGEGVIALVDKDEPDRLAEEIYRLLESPSARNSIARAGRILVQRKYSFSSTLKEMEKIISSVFSLKPDG